MGGEERQRDEDIFPFRGSVASNPKRAIAGSAYTTSFRALASTRRCNVDAAPPVRSFALQARAPVHGVARARRARIRTRSAARRRATGRTGSCSAPSATSHLRRIQARGGRSAVQSHDVLLPRPTVITVLSCTMVQCGRDRRRREISTAHDASPRRTETSHLPACPPETSRRASPSPPRPLNSVMANDALDLFGGVRCVVSAFASASATSPPLLGPVPAPDRARAGA